MQLTNKMNATLLASLVAVSVFALTGCRSGGFTKPELSELAFWKKDGDSMASKSVPPPPARHFDPAPMRKEMEKQSEIVNLDGGNLERRFDNNIAEALNDIKTAAKEPIRTPYSTEIKSTGNDFSPNGLAASAGNVRSKQFSVDNGKSGFSGDSLSMAQKEFQAAMSSAKQSTSNGFAATKKSANEFTQDWKDNIEVPTGLSQAVNQGVDQSLASVNQSLNQANDRMAEVGAQASGAFQAKANDFTNNVGSQIDSASKSANDFLARAQSNVSSATKPNSDFASSNNFAPQGIAPPSANSDFGKIESAQVAEAKQQIERLKMQIENANRNAASSLPNPNSMKHQPLLPAPERVAELKSPGFKSAYTNPGSIGGSPSNGLRPALQPQTPSTHQPLAKQTSPDNFSPSYPSTPHGGFMPGSNSKAGAMSANSNAMPPLKPAAAQAGFASHSNQSNVVTAGSQFPASGSASRIENHVSEVDIPDSILNGKGSYAPGSVNALRK